MNDFFFFLIPCTYSINQSKAKSSKNFSREKDRWLLHYPRIPHIKMKNKHLLCSIYNAKSLKIPRRVKLFTENHVPL